ncbi:sodium-dependent transporter [Pseudoflavonifractor sp. 60]|uniref:sodium-dependent transporter n=1 Tax=Pseudoflavonifractor sp. 60 TaxID=2304576 RepID=UPI00136C3C91|nr:sodium-dependent transporter [Pseudoflavonifractor sp. 60]NBI68541.1 sodium-dependent transporter [Pseudoflavonifractor sp. 60]
MEQKSTRGSFSSSIGFIMAAAGSAVGLGNIWRFPYLAAKDGGGVFILCYIVLALTFGFALLTTEIAIGRKTAQSPLTAYGVLHKNWGFLGVLACLVPTLILPYYCSIGGWVFKYLFDFLTGAGLDSAADGFFTSFITSDGGPVLWMLLFFAATAFVVYSGVNKGIEKYNKILMPILVVLVVGIAFFSLTLSNTDEQGVTRTGLQGLSVYLIPDFTGMTLSKFLTVVLDAMGQMFFSISVSMGIMVAYGSYATKDTNLMRSINQIEIFDTAVALLAGMMIIPAVFTFAGTEGMSAGPGLMFVSLPKIFAAMGGVGNVIGAIFFLMTAFAAVTSAVSVMEAITSSLMDAFHISRRRAATFVSLYAVVGGIIVCLGYNLFYFEAVLPNGTVGQILDILDYLSNNCFMPLIALLTCILIGWIVKPQVIIDEVTQGCNKFSRQGLYVAMMKFIAPVLLFVLLLQSVGVLSWLGL